jgi:hypothetical protein
MRSIGYGEGLSDPRMLTMMLRQCLAPHPDRESDIAEASLQRPLEERPPKAAYALPAKSGER